MFIIDCIKGLKISCQPCRLRIKSLDVSSRKLTFLLFICMKKNEWTNPRSTQLSNTCLRVTERNYIHQNKKNLWICAATGRRKFIVRHSHKTFSVSFFVNPQKKIRFSLSMTHLSLTRSDYFTIMIIISVQADKKFMADDKNLLSLVRFFLLAFFSKENVFTWVWYENSTADEWRQKASALV